VVVAVVAVAGEGMKLHRCAMQMMIKIMMMMVNTKKNEVLPVMGTMKAG
jgi:hypothetical protein